MIKNFIISEPHENIDYIDKNGCIHLSEKSNDTDLYIPEKDGHIKIINKDDFSFKGYVDRR